jgi:hypothetical protein
VFLAFKVFGAFLVDSRLFVVLRVSIVTNSDICLLCSNPKSYNTFSKQLVLEVLFLVSTSAGCQLPNANGLVPFPKRSSSSPTIPIGEG